MIHAHGGSAAHGKAVLPCHPAILGTGHSGHTFGLVNHSDVDILDGLHGLLSCQLNQEAVAVLQVGRIQGRGIIHGLAGQLHRLGIGPDVIHAHGGSAAHGKAVLASHPAILRTGHSGHTFGLVNHGDVDILDGLHGLYGVYAAGVPGQLISVAQISDAQSVISVDVAVMVDISSQLTVNSQLGFAGHILLNESAVGGIYKAVTVGIAHKDDGQLVAVLYSGVIAIGAAVSRYCDDLPHQLTVTDDAQGTGLVTGNRKQVALDRFCCHQRHGLDSRHRGFLCAPASRRRRIGGRTVGQVGYSHIQQRRCRSTCVPGQMRSIIAGVVEDRSISFINNTIKVDVCSKLTVKKPGA